MRQESKAVEHLVEAKANCVTERVNSRQGSRKVTGGRGIWSRMASSQVQKERDDNREGSTS